MKYKVSPTKILIAGALQVVTTTIGFILYKRPYVWALSALEWYDEVYCGTLLDSAKSKYESLPEKYKAQVRTKIQITTAECNEDYLDSFTDKFYDQCFFNAKAAFVSIPIVSTFLIIGIVLCLHWAPFHAKTLKKPAFMLAFMFSLVLVAVNIGQIITILVPIINENASPDHNYSKHRVHQMECGLGAEVTALILMLISATLSCVIAYFIIKLYVMRIRGQKPNLTKKQLRMETMEEYMEDEFEKKSKKKKKKSMNQSDYFDAQDASFAEASMMRKSAENLYVEDPMAQKVRAPPTQIPYAGAPTSGRR